MTPISGRIARLRSDRDLLPAETDPADGLTNHEFEDWSMSLKCNMIEVKDFNKTPDSDGNFWNSYLTGLQNGEATFGGCWNTAKTPTKSFRPGSAYRYNSLFLGLTSSIGFTLTGKCSGIEASTNVKQKGMFKGTFQIEGVSTYPA